MPAISVGSVEVDVLPNAQQFRTRMQAAVLPAANSVGEEVGRIIGRHVAVQVAASFADGINRGGRQAQAPAVRQGQSTGGAFARSFRTRVEAALRDLPDIQIDANSSPAEREIASIRAQLRALTEVEIGVDIDTAEAIARVDRLQARLQRLSAQDIDVQVRTDVAGASAQLAAFQALVNRLDGQTANVDVDTRSAVSSLSTLAMTARLFGPAIVPVLPVVAAGLGSIAAAGVAAAAGIGAVGLVALPAFKQIGTVLQAQKAAQDAATQSTAAGGQASAQASSRALQLASAQQAVASAERSGARQIAQAQAAVSQARRNAGQVAAQAAQRTAEAARAVEDAEEALSDAQRDARRAQDDLTAARRTAAQELQDLNDRLAGSVLSQRDAELSLREATADRDAVLKNANATELDKQRALLAYDQAVQRLKEQTTETRRLRQETAAANRAGVEGSQTVKSAQEQVAQAQEAVADKTRSLKDAQADQARTAQQNAADIADAQQRIADAQANVGEAQVSAAEAAASAQRQLAQAQQQSVGGADAAATAQAKYQAELAKLSPSARQTYFAFLDLREAFGAWSKSLQPAVMPIFTRALVGLKNSLPGLTPFVLAAADAIGGLQDRASAGFKKPWWLDFKKDLATSVGPAITGLGVGFGNIFRGMVNVIGAFLPHMDRISGTMQRVTGRFAEWTSGLKGNPEFAKFLGYSADKAPLIWEALRNIGGALLAIGIAISPVSTVVLHTISLIGQGVQWIAENAPWVVTGIYGIVAAMAAWRVATMLWTGATWLATAAMTALTFVTNAGPWGWIVLAIVAVVGAVILLWTKCEWFRNAVMTVWGGIKGAAAAVRDWFAGPFARFWTQTLPGVFESGWTWIKQRVLSPIKTFFTSTVPGWAVMLRDRVVAPWNGMREGLSDGWTWIKRHILVPFGTYFTKTIPGWGTTLKNKLVEAFNLAREGIKLGWDKIKSIAREPVQFVVDTVYNKGIVGVWNKVADAFGAPPLKEFKFARGGVMPGYTPGRDVHNFVSPTGGRLALSGGEAIMRPEFTRAVGSSFVHGMNAIARSKGASGVKAALAPVFGGNPSAPTDTTLRYADGGIFGWIGKAANTVAGVGSAAWNKIKDGASWLGDTLEASARAGVKAVVNPLLASFPGMDTGFGKMIRRIPTSILDALFGYSKKADKKGGSGLGGPKVQAALRWAKAQAGKPYLWGGVGPKGFDCSGFMGAIENVLRGQKPNSRRWATGAFSGATAPPGWVKNGSSPFRIGITNAGVGHTAGTLGKTKVESRGGDGVVVGSRARGYNSPLFTDWYGFQPGKFDQGGYLQPGMNLAFNGTGRPEPVFTTQQANALTSMAAQGQQRPVVVELHPKAGAIGDFIDVRIGEHDQRLVQVLNAS